MKSYSTCLHCQQQFHVSWPHCPHCMTSCGMRAERPTIVCLCGSTRFGQAFQEANLRETLDGKIVLSIGCNIRSDTDIFGHLSGAEQERIKTRLDKLHMRKIDLADEVLILNVGGYIGYSTERELAYARHRGKRVRFLEGQDNADTTL